MSGTVTTGTYKLYGPSTAAGAAWTNGTQGAAYASHDGFDLIVRQKQLQDQMAAIEDDIRALELNSNLSDTEKMFSMQMAMNSWSAISNLRTNMLKSVADTLKSIARNVN